MPGRRILYVPPRLVGSLKNWAAGANGAGSWLIQHAKEMGFNALWFSPFHVSTKIGKQKDGQWRSESLYAIRDHFAIGKEFSQNPAAPDAAADMQALRGFLAEAKREQMTVYADLVLNHVAADHALVEGENADLAALRQVGGMVSLYADGNGRLNQAGDGSRVGFVVNARDAARLDSGLQQKLRPDGAGNYHYLCLFHREADGALFADGPPEDKWIDIAKINYSSPAAWEYFVAGTPSQQPYWQKVVDWYLDAGFTGFRCDAVYWLPRQVWDAVLNYAKEKCPEVMIQGETLGLSDYHAHEMNQTRDKKLPRSIYDVTSLELHRWDYADPAMLYHEAARANWAAHYGTIGFVDCHDSPHTLAGWAMETFHCPITTARIALRNYAAAVFMCNSHFMQLGFEFSKETANHVFAGSGSFAEWQELVKDRTEAMPELDLRAEIKALNELKEAMRVDGCKVTYPEFSVSADGRLARLCCAYIDAETGIEKGRVRMLINRQPERGAVFVDTTQEAHGLQRSTHSMREAQLQNAVLDVMIFHSPLPGMAAPVPQNSNKPTAPKLVA